MKSKSNISLSEINKNIQMNIPEGYQEELSQAIFNKTSNSLLESIKKDKVVFEIPSNYFIDLQNDIIAQTSDATLEHSFIKNWQEKYFHIKNTELFTTPDKYFDLLPAKIQLAIHNQNKKWDIQIEELFLSYIWKPVPILATMLCFVASYFVLNSITPSNTKIAQINKVNIEELSNKEITEYLAFEDNTQQDIIEEASKSKIKTTDVFKNEDIKVDHKTIEESISSEDIEELTLEEL